MKTRPLGRTGLQVSEIGFGSWGIGGASRVPGSYGPTDDQVSLQALRRAFASGVTFYDTSDLYGYGHSEALIGTAFRAQRSRVVIASKVGYLEHNGGPQDFSPGHVRQALEGTLRRLQSEYVDLYQLHNPPLRWLERDGRAWDTLEALRGEGKARAIGISVRSPQDGLTALRRFPVQTLQVNFNLIDQRALDVGLLEACQARGVGVIGRTPLCFGFLTGRYPADSRFGPLDHRSAWSPEQVAVWATASQRFLDGAQAPRPTPTQLALRFCLSYGGLSTVIPGMLTPEQVEENVAASRLGPLSSADLRHIAQVYRTHTFFLGKSALAVGAASPAA